MLSNMKSIKMIILETAIHSQDISVDSVDVLLKFIFVGGPKL